MARLSIITEEAQPMAPPIIADRRLYLTADKARVVEEGDRSAAFLLAGAGGEIASLDADRLGLGVHAGRVVLPGTMEPKALEKPADKARKRGEDK